MYTPSLTRAPVVLMIHYNVLTIQPVLVITTGKQTTDQGVLTDLGVASSRLQSKGAAVFSLGIGEDLDTSELGKIASGPDNVFSVDSFEDLDDKVKEIKRGLCLGIK